MPQFPEDSDTTLLERLRVADTAAFEELLRRHYPMVYRVVYGVVGTAQAAEDLAQDTFAFLYRQPPQLDGATVLGTWLYRTAIHRAFDALRAAPPDPDEAAARRAERAWVRAALARLPTVPVLGALRRAAGLGPDAGSAP